MKMTTFLAQLILNSYLRKRKATTTADRKYINNDILRPRRKE